MPDAPSSDGGDSGRAAAADGMARGGPTRLRRGGRGGRWLQRRVEATMADGGGGRRPWQTEATVADGGGDAGMEPARRLQGRKRRWRMEVEGGVADGGDGGGWRR